MRNQVIVNGFTVASTRSRRSFATLILMLGLVTCGGVAATASAESRPIDYEAFLAQHDMVWDRVPPRWELAPFSGNGNVGFLFYQDTREARNVISVHVGRHD